MLYRLRLRSDAFFLKLRCTDLGYGLTLFSLKLCCTDLGYDLTLLAI